jgi:23S rRNA pseudouridine2605 synthase
MDSRKPGTKKPPAPVRRIDGADENRRDGERIAKRLARAGVASRRDAENIIAAGRVSVNGKLLSSPAFNVAANDRIEIDGKPIPAIERTRLFLFHKPAGVVTTNRDPEGRKTVFDILPADLPRLLTVGRLDMATEGLLLLTNDGGLARMLELPSTGWLRRYRVRVHGEPDAAKLAALKDGIAIDGVFYGAVEAEIDRIQGSNAWLTVSLREGKNREVRNIMTELGLAVNRLIRVSYGPFQLADLETSEIREIKGRTLRDQLGDRLIAESGANFEAPVIKPFSSKSATDTGDRNRQVKATAGKPDQDEARRRSKPADRRLDALDRLQTRPQGAPRKGSKDGTQDRSSHVWMAPGARPMGKKKAEEQAAREARRHNDTASKPGPGKDDHRKHTGRKDGPRNNLDKREGERPSRPHKPKGEGRSGPPRGKGNADRRR